MFRGAPAFLCSAHLVTPSGETATKYLLPGMQGIGNDRAARIWYRALTTYFTSGMTHVDARHAGIRSAQDLYGKGSAEEVAVCNAFAGVNVGEAVQ